MSGRGGAVALWLAVTATLALLTSAPFAFADARFDPSFGDNGIAIQATDDPGNAYSVAEDSQGRLVAVGYSDLYSRGDCHDFYVARFLPSGDPDPSFAGRGYQSSDTAYGDSAPCDFTTEVAMRPKGDGIVLAGLTPSESVVISLRADGTPEPAFSDRPDQPGRRWIFLSNPSQGQRSTRPLAATVDRSGRTLIAGAAHRLGSDRGGAFLLRLRRDGTLDPRFRGDHRTRTQVPGLIELLPDHGHYAGFEEVKALPSGKILLAGYKGGRFMAARLLTDGSLDRSFGKRGVARVDADGSRSCECSVGTTMIRDYHGRIIVAGYTTMGPVDYSAVVRLRRDGRLDRSFGHNGVARPQTERRFETTGVAVQRNGRIVLTGQAHGALQLVRLTTDGILDPTFFNGGVLSDWDFNGPATAYDVIIDHAGRIVVAGALYRPGLMLARILPR